MNVATGPAARCPFWRYVNAPHRWLKRFPVMRYWDCVECGRYVLDMAAPQAITWPWRFNTVGPCSRAARDGKGR